MAAAAFWTWTRAPVWEAASTLRVEERNGELPAEERALLLGRPAGQIETEMRVLEARPVRLQVVDRLSLGFRVVEPAEVPRDVLFDHVAAGASAPEARYRVSREGDDRWTLARIGEDGETASRSVSAGDTVELSGASFVLAADSALREAGVEPPGEIRVRTVPPSKAAGALEKALTVRRPDPDARLIAVRYRGTDRHLVREVPDAVVAAFLQRRRRVQNTEARSTVAFLEDQTSRIRTQLEAAEEELQRFRERERVVAPAAQAEAQVKQRAEMRARRSELAAERDALSRLVRGLEGPEAPSVDRVATFPTFIRNQGVQSLFESLVQTREEKAAMLQRRTEDHPEVVALQERIDQLEGQLAGIGRDYLASLNEQIASLDAQLARFGSRLEEVPAQEVQLARLERRTELLTELHTTLQKRLKEAQVREAVEDPSIRVVEAAVLPGEPVSPKPFRNMAFAGFLGLVLGVGLAFVREYTDRSIRSDDEVDRMLGTPLLSRIPRVPDTGENYPRQNGLVTAGQGDSLPAESYRTLRTNVRYTRAGDGAREMVITSPGARDGKSITASNLAIAFAQQGLATALVDADMRRSVQHDAFNVGRDPGLADYLANGADLLDVTRRTGVDGLRLVPSGARPPNPAELLDGPRMAEFLEEARERFDALVVDTPPTLVVTDAAVVGPHLEGVLLVVRADQTDREAAVDAMLQLRRVGCDVLGVVLNDASPQGRYAYGSEYYEYYGEDGGKDGLRRLLPFV
jgi:tyrosine-protein kinase Etk/Wzc